MRGMKLFAIVGLAVALVGLGMVPANAQQSCDPTGPFRQWILGNLGNANVIVIAIDNSGSIREAGRLPTEKTCAINAVEQLKGKFFAVLSFNSSVTIVQRPTNNTDTLIKAINSIQDTSNSTLMDGAIDDACQFTQPVRPNGALLLLTDGIPTATRRPTTDPTTAAEQAASNFKANCSTLAVIGVDIQQGSDEDKFLGRIASPGAYGATSSTGGGFEPRRQAAPTLSLSTSSISFGSVSVGSSASDSFTISNSGGGILEGSISCSGDCRVFELSRSSFRLAAGEALRVQVTFRPSSATSYSATLNISSNGGSASVSLRGSGHQPPPPQPPQPPPPRVPTLTEWGLIALGLLLAGSLAFMIRRRFAPRPAGA